MRFPTFILADNQALTKAGVRSLIMQWVRGARLLEASCKKELLTTLAETQSGIVVLDYALFDLRGAEDVLVLQRRFPDVMWLLMSMELSGDFLRRMMAEDNVSVLLKDAPAEEVRACLENVSRGERYICSQVANYLRFGKESCGQDCGGNPLTPTETEILRLIAHGRSVKEIAEARTLSTHTVVTHKKNIFRKLGVNNVYEATKYALRAGLVEMMEYYI